MKRPFKGKKRIHFIGVGGIGMSAIARILVEMGYKVSGSDLVTNDLTEGLSALGAAISLGHSVENIPKGAELAVYSSSIDIMLNPEVVRARESGIRIMQRASALGELLNPRKGIAVTGTHGKTTTTSLIAVMLDRLGYRPTVAIGGEVDYFRSNARFGKGDWMVAEADESDGSFTRLKPFYSVVTNIEIEHVDYYKSIEDVIGGYTGFVSNTKPGGIFFYNNDDENVRKVLKRYKGESRSYGLGEGALIYPLGIKMDRFRTSFRCIYKGKDLGEVRLRIPGRHNVSNSLAAILVGLEMGIDFGRIKEAIGSFRGARRRFQARFASDGIMLIDDYAHHPTEIEAVIEAARAFRPRRIVAVFQPHRYTRTKSLKREFGLCFRGVDKLVLTDIYPASERPIKGVSIKMLYDEVRKIGCPADVSVLDKGGIPLHIMKTSRRGDIILVMGAGSIKKVSDDLARLFEMRSSFRVLKGKVSFCEPLSRHTTLGIGGPADVWVEPRGYSELKKVLAVCRKRGWSTCVIGRGSNILARDEGWRGVVISLTSPDFKRLKIDGADITVGAGYNIGVLIKEACRRGLGGLESLVGIPGTVGGAIFMNAGGAANPVFNNIGKLVTSLEVMDRKGRISRLDRDKIEFGYRSSGLDRYIILSARLRLAKENKKILVSRSFDFLRLKRAKQVLDAPSAGCIFKNPADYRFTAGQMIDMLGFKGNRIGGALVSPKHANFIVNTGGATSKDVFCIIDSINKKVMSTYKMPLELEVRVL